MSQLKLLLGFVLIAQLSGCAVISRSECLDGNWQKVGYRVGADGYRDTAGEFSKRANICAKHGVEADFRAFERGHAEGIERFCDIGNAVKLGARGARRAIDDQVCPEERYIGFESAFYKGYRLHELRSQAAEIQQQIDYLQSQQYQYQRRSQELSHQIQSGNLNQQQVRRAEYRRRQLRRQVYDLRSRMQYSYDRLRRREQIVREYESLLDSEFGG